MFETTNQFLFDLVDSFGEIRFFQIAKSRSYVDGGIMFNHIIVDA